MYWAMSEEQLKAAEAEVTEEQGEDAVEEISEEDLEGVADGISAGFGISAVVRQEPKVKYIGE